MDPRLCCHCLEIFRKALSSPVGESFSSNFHLIHPLPDASVNLFSALDKLTANSYPSVGAWLSDVSSITDNTVRYFGDSSDMALAVLTIRQLILDSVRPFLASEQSNYAQILHTFADSFAACIAAIPSRSAEEPTASDVPPTARAAVEPPPLDPIDLNELKLMIQHLDTDHDLQHVGRLIARHQPQYSGCSGVVDFDLRVCSPKTLHIVHEFLRQRTAAAEGARPILPMISSSQKPPLILPVAPLLRMRTAPPPLAVQFGPVDVKPNVATEKKAIEDAT